LRFDAAAIANAAQRAKAGGVDGYRPHMSLLAKQVHYLSATTPLKNWQAALVLPQACGILEILLHELVRGLFGWNALKWEANVHPKKLVRLPKVAPGHSPWRGDILLLNHSRMESKRAGSCVSRLAVR
jgi:hypothetical protein